MCEVFISAHAQCVLVTLTMKGRNGNSIVIEKELANCSNGSGIQSQHTRVRTMEPQRDTRVV